MTGYLKLAKILGPLFALLGLAIYIHSLQTKLAHRNATVTSLTQWQDGAIAAVAAQIPVERRASVTDKTAYDEIFWLGREYRTAVQALADQSAALRQAAAETTAAQNNAAAARKRALQADSALSATKEAIRKGGLTQNEWSKL
jgi:hypothetical protein